MQPFEFITAHTVADAVQAQASAPAAQQGAPIRFIAGGTNLVDFMKLNVETPRQLVDITALPLNSIDRAPDGSLTIGALARNTDVAIHSVVREQFPVLSQAILSGASAQLRNMASTAGNLLQKTRCVYFRDTACACNKRQPGSGCSAIGGYNRTLAILGTSEHCIASNPSDQNVALAALEATIHITGPVGERKVPIADFYLLPGNTPHLETVLRPGDLITHVSVPALPAGTRSLYLKLRDRASYEFALSSAAVAVKLSNGRIDFARVALGGVGAVPWRSREAEAVLHGKPPSPELFRRAAAAALHGARPQSQNGFKVELAQRCLTHALTQATQQA
jgi:xanthine dehydrogenase YagS FAD-binding subunit